MTDDKPLALVKGAGDLATGAALCFQAAGFRVLMTELPEPTAVRLSVSFARAVFDGSHAVEGVLAELATPGSWPSILEAGGIAVLVDPECSVRKNADAAVVIDAVMAKSNTGTSMDDAPVVIALGPGFTAGVDADAVIETMRGHDLGRIIRRGGARGDTGIPGDIGGRTAERVLRAPRDGRVSCLRRIGDIVTAGEALMSVEDFPVLAPFDGCLRGMIRDGLVVGRAMKIGDVDPRGNAGYVNAVSDKSRAVGRAAVEAALSIGRERGVLRVLRI